MAARTKKARPGMRLELGDSLLAAARVADTRLVTDSLGRFEQVHRRYAGAQRKVLTAHAAIRTARARLAKLQAARAHAVEVLARALAVDGHDRKRAFATFGAPPPSAIGRMAVSDGNDAIERLVTAVLRGERVGRHSVVAAHSALASARAVARELDAVAKLEDAARAARTTRDAIGRRWDVACRGLRSKAIAAQDDGAPELHPTLFPPRRRRRKSNVPGDSASAP